MRNSLVSPRSRRASTPVRASGSRRFEVDTAVSVGSDLRRIEYRQNGSPGSTLRLTEWPRGARLPTASWRRPWRSPCRPACGPTGLPPLLPARSAAPPHMSRRGCGSAGRDIQPAAPAPLPPRSTDQVSGAHPCPREPCFTEMSSAVRSPPPVAASVEPALCLSFYLIVFLLPCARRRLGREVFGKMPTTSVRRLISLLRRSCGLFDHTCFQWATAKAGKANSSGPAANSSAAWGKRSSSMPTMRACCARTSSREGCC